MLLVVHADAHVRTSRLDDPWWLLCGLRACAEQVTGLRWLFCSGSLSISSQSQLPSEFLCSTSPLLCGILVVLGSGAGSQQLRPKMCGHLHLHVCVPCCCPCVWSGGRDLAVFSWSVTLFMIETAYSVVGLCGDQIRVAIDHEEAPAKL